MDGIHSATNDSAGPISRPLRVLVAEDTAAARQLLATMLKNRGHSVDTADDGMEAVQKVRDHEYDVVFMDLQMPVLDGLQATTVIRRMADPVKAALPIVAVTTFAWPRQRERCLTAGMNGFLPKPLDTAMLLRTVETVTGSLPRHV